MKNAKSRVPLLPFLFGHLPTRLQFGMMRFGLPRRMLKEITAVPGNLDNLKNVLIIMPEDPFEAMLHISTIIGLTALARNAEVALVCTNSVAPLFGTIRRIKEIHEYDPALRHVFSPFMKQLAQSINQHPVDVCLILEKKCDLSLLLLAAKTGAPVRAGFYAEHQFPFINVRFRLSETATQRSDRHLDIIRLFGPVPAMRNRWSVSREAIEEARYLLREMRISPDTRFACVDGRYFFNEFGESWSRETISRIGKLGLSCVSLAVDDGPLPNSGSDGGTGDFQIPAFSRLPVSRSAALIRLAAIVVAGRSTLFELARLVGTPTVGVFADSESQSVSQPDPQLRIISYISGPDEPTIDSVIENARSLLTQVPPKNPRGSQLRY